MIYDSVATQSTAEDALHMIRSGGKIVMIGMGYSLTKKVDWAAQIYKEITITGTFLQSPGSLDGITIDPYEFAMQYMSQHVELFEKFVTHRFPIHHYKNAFATLLNKDKFQAIKVVFDYT
jgi:threonine dehydrogenase-like Zn-dependent dehydrogenase